MTVPVKGVRFGREIGVAWREGRYFGPAIRHLLDAVFERFGVTADGMQGDAAEV